MAALEHADAAPTLTCADVTQCSICHWYPLNKKHTFKTIVVPASRAFVEFLGSDGPMVIPETAKGARVASRGRTAVDDDCELSDDESAPAPRNGRPSSAAKLILPTVVKVSSKFPNSNIFFKLCLIL